jgi:hypothetical protein
MGMALRLDESGDVARVDILLIRENGRRAYVLMRFLNLRTRSERGRHDVRVRTG